MARSSSSTTSPRKRFLLSAAAAATAAAAAALSAATTGASADIIARPPFFVPQRADNLILSGGRDAGDWETLSALRDAGLPCYGNMCEKKGTEAAASAMGELEEEEREVNGFGILRGRSAFCEMHLAVSLSSSVGSSGNTKVVFGQPRHR